MKIWRYILRSEGFMLAHVDQSGFILVHVGSKWGTFGVGGVSWEALGGTMGASIELRDRLSANNPGAGGPGKSPPYCGGEPLHLRD